MKNIAFVFKRLFRWIPWSAGLTMAYYVFSALLPGMAAIISIHLFENAAKVLNGAAPLNDLIIFALLYLLIYLINDLLAYIMSITLNAGIYEKGTAYFRIELYEHLAELPLLLYEDSSYLDRRERAINAVNNEQLSSLFNQTCRVVSSVVSVLGVAIVFARYSLWMILFALLTVIPYLVVRILRGQDFTRIRRIQAKQTRKQRYLWELFTKSQSIAEMRVMGFDEYLGWQWQLTRNQVNDELWRQEKRDALSLLVCDGIRIIGYGMSIALVLILVVRGRIPVGVFGAALASLSSLQSGMKTFLEQIGRMPELISCVADYRSLLEQRAEKDGVAPFNGLKQGICLEDVSFRYPGRDNNAVESVNLCIQPNERIAIVGVNGSGKTTLAKIILGLYPPTSGSVLYDGLSHNEYQRDTLNAYLSAVIQDFPRYQLTVRENVAISDIKRLADDSGILRSLMDVGINAPNLDEQIGRVFEGQELSGGQWQRMALARGLFRESALILLDEPTSALDPLVENEILTKFLHATHNKTAVLISHRIGLCKRVDRILVMRDGHIVEDGQHETLLAKGGEYAKLYGEQAKWY
ncbi:MAG: ABC transporter ATP-binding protein/permease [Chloroflexi bacterium]|nr:ABC transporter ATP-binding protein/permease [Chloroflexota bacterium]